MPKALRPTKHAARVPNVTAKPSRAISPAQIVLANADRITIELAKTRSWSMWHSWAHISYINKTNSSTPKKISEYIADRQMPAPHAFATCVDVAQEAAKRLQSKLGKDKDPAVRTLRKEVKLYAVHDGIGGLPEHCLAAVLLPDCCIVMDVFFHFHAFIVPLGGTFDSMPYITLRGLTSVVTYHYHINEKGNPTLALEGAFSVYGLDEVTEISYVDAVRDINFRLAALLADERCKRKNVPAQKCISMARVLPKEPKKLPFIAVQDGFLANTCKLSVCYARQSILIQVPRADWLNGRTPAIQAIALALEGYEMLDLVKCSKGAVSNIRVELRQLDSKLMERIEFVGGICEDFGLSKKLFYWGRGTKVEESSKRG